MKCATLTTRLCTYLWEGSKRLPLLIMLIGFAFCHAQQTPDEQEVPKDPEAKKILDELSAKTKTYKSIRVEFSYNLYNKDEDIDETQEGIVTMMGDKYKLEIAGQEILNNGETQWVYIKDDDEVQIDDAPDPSEDEDAISPIKLFTIYEKGFKYKYFGEETKNGKTTQIIKLYPIDANKKSYHTIILNVDKTKKQFDSIQVLSKDGNKYTYMLKKFETNLGLNDSYFNFDTSKAGDVIDLR
ncbi:MAG: hypothetical protein COA57_07645 [Flavobacteriales bacterium]|nr:MAG: hypothetical protein COA57_07645 [Flavobacteriales bacterium]